jgi:hypothetical protein
VENNKLDKNKFYNLYPNPSEGVINVDGDYRYVEVYDISGRILRKYEPEEIIDLTLYGNSFMLVRIVGELFEQTEKVLLK